MTTIPTLDNVHLDIRAYIDTDTLAALDEIKLSLERFSEIIERTNEAFILFNGVPWLDVEEDDDIPSRLHEPSELESVEISRLDGFDALYADSRGDW